jgi:hypothetical protein
MTETLNASLITAGVILFSWTAPTWYTFLTFQRSYASPQKAISFSIGALVWGLVMSGVVRYGWLDNFPGGRSVAFLVTLAIPVTMSLLFVKSIVGPGLSQRWLVGLQIFRIIGAVFILEWARGQLPAIFALPAGIGDIIVGVVAIGVVLHSLRQGYVSPSGAAIVAILGIMDFISAFFFGFFSSAGPWQIFSISMPNQVSLYPTGLIPFYLVPYACISHVLSLYVAWRHRDIDFQKTGKLELAS